MADTTPLDYTSLPHTKAIQTGAHTHTHTHTHTHSEQAVVWWVSPVVLILHYESLVFKVCVFACAHQAASCFPKLCILANAGRSKDWDCVRRLDIQASERGRKLSCFFFFRVYTFGKKITPRVRENVTQARVWSAAVFPFSHAALMDSPHV